MFTVLKNFPLNFVIFDLVFGHQFTCKPGIMCMLAHVGETMEMSLIKLFVLITQIILIKRHLARI